MNCTWWLCSLTLVNASNGVWLASHYGRLQAQCLGQEMHTTLLLAPLTFAHIRAR